MIAEVASAEQADVDAAVAAARAAFDGPWGKLSARERGELVWKIGEKLMERADEIARLETLHNGKPIFESRQIEVPAAAECFQYFAGWADKIHGETIPVKGNYLTYTLREPVGVVAAIVPWNFPLLLTAWKVAPALACGNTVIIKPASQTPLTALALGRDRARGRPAARRAQRHHRPGIDGRPDDRRASRHRQDRVHRRHVDRQGDHARLGRHAEAASRSSSAASRRTSCFPTPISTPRVRGATTGIFYGKGEVCAAGSRLLVDKSIKSEFIDKVAARAKKMAPGDPLDPKTRLGAISSKKQLENDLRYIEIAKQEGATLVAGGGRADIGTGKGYFLQPTVFDGVTPEMTIAREEIFGPVLAAIEFADVDEAIARANDSNYGLAAAVWTKDIKKAHYVARKLQAGTVWINTYNVYDTAAPFGGYKQSGFGREMSMHALEHYTQVKSVWVDLNL